MGRQKGHQWTETRQLTHTRHVATSELAELTSQLKRLRRGAALQDVRVLDRAPMLVSLALEAEGETASRDLPRRTRAAKRMLLEALEALDETSAEVMQVVLGLRADVRHRETGERRAVIAKELARDPRTIMRIEDAAFPTLANRVFDLHAHAVRQRVASATTSAPPRATDIGASASPTAIGVLAPYSCWPTDYYRQIVEGIRRAADREREDLQRSLVVLDVPRDNQRGELLTALQSGLLRDIAGLVTINVSLAPPLRDLAIERSVPVVSVNHEEDALPVVCNVLHDHAAFAELVSRTLAHRDVDAAILVTKTLDNPLKDLERDPFRLEKRQIFSDQASASGLKFQDPLDLDGLQVLNVRPRCAYVLEIDHYRPQAGERLFQIMKTDSVRTVALICLADAVALGYVAAARSSANKELQQLNVRLTGFDNTDLGALSDLTSIDYRLDAVGRLAYEQVQIAIDYPRSPPPVTQFVASEYCERGSSRWPAS